MSLQEFFEKRYHDLVLRKSLDLKVGQAYCYIELTDNGDSLCLYSVLYESKKGFSESFLIEIESLEAKGICVDTKRGQVLIARKHDFRSMSPHLFGLRMTQFVSEIQMFRKDIDGFTGKEYALIRRK